MDYSLGMMNKAILGAGGCNGLINRLRTSDSILLALIIVFWTQARLKG